MAARQGVGGSEMGPYRGLVRLGRNVAMSTYMTTPFLDPQVMCQYDTEQLYSPQCCAYQLASENLSYRP